MNTAFLGVVGGDGRNTGRFVGGLGGGELAVGLIDDGCKIGGEGYWDGGNSEYQYG